MCVCVCLCVCMCVCVTFSTCVYEGGRGVCVCLYECLYVCVCVCLCVCLCDIFSVASERAYMKGEQVFL